MTLVSVAAAEFASVAGGPVAVPALSIRPECGAGYLEHARYQKLRAELSEHLQPRLAIGYYTGMRISDVLGLRWSKVDLAASVARSVARSEAHQIAESCACWRS